jgi:hypothetical protein
MSYLKIFEAFPIVNEYHFVEIRKALAFKTGVTFKSFDCNYLHDGSCKIFDQKKDDYLNSSLLISFIDEIIKKTIIKNKEYYLKKGIEKNWDYEFSLRANMFEWIKINCPDYDYFLFSDADEITDINLNYEIQKLDCPDVINIAQTMYMGSPYFKYKTPYTQFQRCWLGPVLVSKKFLFSLNSTDFPIFFHKQRGDLVNIKNVIYNGFHMTYLGDETQFKNKCKSIAERNHKRVIMAKYIGLILLKLGHDPFLKKGFGVSINKDKEFINFIKKYYNLDFITPYFFNQ